MTTSSSDARDNYRSETIYNKDNKNLPVDEQSSMETGEQCTYRAAQNYYKIAENNIFDINIIPKSDQDKINKWRPGDEEDSSKEYSLCNKHEGTFYYNCALDKKNIWLTKDTDNKCKINEKIALPPKK